MGGGREGGATSKLASLCSRVAQGSFPKALLTFRWARGVFVKPFVGVPVLVGGARLESTGRQGRGPLGTGSVPAAPALGTVPPSCPSPPSPVYPGMRGSTN